VAGIEKQKGTRSKRRRLKREERLNQGETYLTGYGQDIRIDLSINKEEEVAEELLLITSEEYHKDHQSGPVFVH
jgi:hypothetical protein